MRELLSLCFGFTVLGRTRLGLGVPCRPASQAECQTQIRVYGILIYNIHLFNTYT